MSNDHRAATKVLITEAAVGTTAVQLVAADPGIIYMKFRRTSASNVGLGPADTVDPADDSTMFADGLLDHANVVTREAYTGDVYAEAAAVSQTVAVEVGYRSQRTSLT